MNSPLKVLVLEDQVLDYELLLRALRRGGYKPQAIRVETGPQFEAALRDDHFDAILVDYTLPRYDAPSALDHVRASGLDTPVIVVTGSIGEEQAVACMRQGASDYLLKDRLTRLGSAVAQALEQRQLRRDKAAAMQAIEERESRFRALLERSSDVIVLLDRLGQVQYVSASVQRVLGYTQDELIGCSAADYVVPERLTETIAQYRELATSPGAHISLELTMWHKDGSTRVLDVTFANLSDDPSVEGFVANAHDITERIDLENRYRHAQKMEAIGRLAGKIAHDFRNHLTVINGYSQMTLLDLEPEHPATELVEEAYSAGQRAADLAQKLLTFSRREDSEQEVFDLNQRMRDTTGVLSQLIAESVTVRTEIAPGAAWVKTDPTHVDQVLMNLAVNASDAMPEGGTLTIRTEAVERTSADLDSRPEVLASPGRFISLSISDTGIGMDQRVRASLFEPFFTTKAPGKGTGLGLATVYGMVTGAGGYIDVESQPGEGSTFRVYWPEIAAPEHAAPTNVGEPDEESGSETILVVEDEASVLMLVRSVLGRMGYRVFEARDGEAALRVLDEIGVDLVLTDVIMPGRSGPELVKAMRARRPGLRTLYMSGYTGDDLEGAGMAGHIDPLIRKPFTPDQLGHAVRLALDSEV